MNETARRYTCARFPWAVCTSLVLVAVAGCGEADPTAADDDVAMSRQALGEKPSVNGDLADGAARWQSGQREDSSSGPATGGATSATKTLTHAGTNVPSPPDVDGAPHAAATYQPQSPYLSDPDLAISFVEDIAAFRLRARDDVHGGFYTFINRQGNPTSENTKSLCAQSRLGYAFTRAFALTGNEAYLDHAHHALKFLYDHGWSDGWLFATNIEGGYIPHWGHDSWWSFQQHYALVGIAAMVEVTGGYTNWGDGSQSDWDWLNTGLNSNYTRLWDANPATAGYFDRASRNWSSKWGKSFHATVDAMTTHSVLLALMTNDPAHDARHEELAENVMEHMVAAMATSAVGFPEVYTSDWSIDNSQPQSEPGHQYKAAWCLYRSYLMDPSHTEYKEAADAIMWDVWENGGYDHVYGGPFSKVNWQTGQTTNTNKNNWMQEQGITAGLTGYHAATTEEDQDMFLEVADGSARFFMEHQLDPVYGEAYSDVTRNGSGTVVADKGGLFNSGYHSIEMGYYIYLYGNLFLHHQPVSLYYRFPASSTEQQFQLTPLSIEDALLRIGSVTLDGATYSDFDGATRTLTLAPGVGGVFRVTFTVGAICGDGTVGPGEACDDAGESATCNADCTPFAIGDGIINVTAGEECDDGNASDGDECSSAGVAAKLETRQVTVGSVPATVALTNSYASPVVVCSSEYTNNTVSVVPRVSNVASDSFDVYLQNPADGAVTAEDVSCLVVEAGIWNIQGLGLEARTYESTITDRKGNWQGEGVDYGQAYSAPVVLGQVMTNNDSAWSVFWSSDGTRTEPASSSSLWVGKHVGRDPNPDRTNETVGYVVLEAGSGELGGIPFTAELGADAVRGIDNGAPARYEFSVAFATPPRVMVVAQAAMDGNEGSWAHLVGPSPTTPTSACLRVDEDQLVDPARRHSTEQVAYLAFESTVLYPPGADCVYDADCDDARFCNGAETCVSGACQLGTDPCPGGTCDEALDTCWSDADAAAETHTAVAGGSPITIALQNSYPSPVVVCSAEHANNPAPVVVRVSNVTPGSFDVYLQNPSGAAPVAENVTCLVVEEGVWVMDDLKLEARTYLSTVTDARGSWMGENRLYGQAYANPVVIGQVMSDQDPAWSVFWSHGGARAEPPSPFSLWVGKHVGQDPNQVRADETVGYLVLEAGSGTIGGNPFVVALGPDTVRGVDNRRVAEYEFPTPFATTPEITLVGQSAMDGSDGSWAYLLGPSPTDTTSLRSVVDEDQLADSERVHTTEQVAFLALQQTLLWPD